jgi:Lar family restriction alleviation protein
MIEKSILRCPFCGCADVGIYVESRWGRKNVIGYAECANCGARGPEAHGYMDVDQRTAFAREKWNHRLPTVEPKRGRWIKSETSEAFDIAGVKTWALKAKCSECGFVHKFIEAHMCYGYCPNCGAKMEGEENDE